MRSDPRPKPAMARHCETFHAYLKAGAKLNDKGELIWEGSLTKAFQDCGLHIRYYTPVRALLLDTDSIEILHRGNRNSLSVIRVLPLGVTPEALENISSGGLTGDTRAARLRDMELRLNALEGWRDGIGRGELNIAEVLRNFEMRITALEAALISNGNNATSD